MPTLIKVTCEKCKIEFEKPIGKVNEANKRGASHYCGRKCFHGGRKPYGKQIGKKVEVGCDYCKTTFIKHENQLKLTTHNFCSSECMGNFRKGKRICEYIKLTCSYCKNNFEILPSQYKHRLKLSKLKKLTCSFTCGRKISTEIIKAKLLKIKPKTFTGRSKLEEFIEQQILITYPELYCIYNGRYFGLELDLYIPSLGIAIEFNGPRHYKPINNQIALDLIQMKDRKKKIFCKDHSVQLYIIDNLQDNRRKSVLINHWLQVQEILIGHMAFKNQKIGNFPDDCISTMKRKSSPLELHQPVLTNLSTVYKTEGVEEVIKSE